MGEQQEKKPVKRICAGLLAHVDAGKTTLSESLLCLAGKLRQPGRVDHGDAYLDTYALEKERGITIFSKQAVFTAGGRTVTLLDTPGHVDFSAEMERTLAVLDCAVLVISGADGVQGHTRTLWKLLEEYGIPAILFVNKMDQEGTSRSALLAELKENLEERCVDFSGGNREEWLENTAVCDDRALEEYLEQGDISQERIQEMVGARQIFPCYFGSALRMEGVDALLEGLVRYAPAQDYPEAFAARVFKITRDSQGNRLTHLKVTGGTLKVKMPLTGGHGEEAWEEKVNQIRLYSGDKFETAAEAKAGTVCAVTGLSRTYAGQGLGAEEGDIQAQVEPVMNYRVLLPAGSDKYESFRKLSALGEEDPQLHLTWQAATGDIHVQLMGEVQTEILQTLARERCGLEISFGEGAVVYKETIAQAAEGVGHFEPLRHYAEVHLLLEPGEPGSGVVLDSSCSEDMLDSHWQRVILSHLAEREHPGILTGAPVTDIRITLIGGRAHEKHTEGGDFREATYRAVRQGLKKAGTVLLEPWYTFVLEVPREQVGRAMSDIQKRGGELDPPGSREGQAVLTGRVPAASVGGYYREVLSYTRGTGKFTVSFDGYAPCHNAGEVADEIGYDWERDVDNPTGSVFCTGGAGFYVPWDQVEDYMHVHCSTGAGLAGQPDGREEDSRLGQPGAPGRGDSTGKGEYGRMEKELEEIFVRTYGPVRRKLPSQMQPPSQTQPPGRQEESRRAGTGRAGTGEKEHSRRRKAVIHPGEYLLVDGYNMIFAWKELKSLAERTIDGARTRLMDILSDYQGYRRCRLILVFDAYRREGHPEEIVKYHNIYVVYTKEAQTADQYIEKTVREMAGKHAVTVATSDGLEQIIIRGGGARLLSATELLEEIVYAREEIRRDYMNQPPGERNYLFDYLEKDLADAMEDVRLGKKEME